MLKIAVIPGDGIGKEVTDQGLKVMEYLNGKNGLQLTLDKFELGAERYLKNGEVLPEKVLKKLETYNSIYLGAVGDPRVPAGVLEQGILLKLRFYFDQYVNLRPVKLFKDDFSPLKNKGVNDIDFTVIRENTEGLYAGVGGFLKKNTPDEVAIQEMVNTRKGVDRVIKYAFEYALKYGKEPKVTLCDKSNVLTYAHNLWQRAFKDIAVTYPRVETDHFLVDAITMKMVRNPEIFDVIVTCNMFGDIITDLGAELQGGMGLAVSGNINPDSVSMFEPVHGSAPDIAGQNKANPLAAILAVGMMLKHLGYSNLGDRVEKAVEQALKENQVTPDMGGNLSTDEVGNYIVTLLKQDREGEDDE
ncbi:3-isopropylmalate dehydrogenase [Halothermothrix orenii]|uniref:3-isopropylmalate dehydrogenase n=1 Tax=Halothermothrix orenii (strain H 168 / OCM 544 / DSM 9562) TaxID=373903 RepID=B8CX24_HALOH|nr:3-isopropylmalate dehydrogenase [Halothermothrix orenii]ACL69843.1 3-isopropylmalate dehydrogenase [Halothermothrix orenii H 168]